MRKLAIVAVLVVGAATMAARPPSEFDLLTRLNGQPTRFKLADGGQSGLFTTYDGGAANGMACATLTGATDQRGASFTPSVLLFMPEVPVNICVVPWLMPNGVMQPWDGGCNTNDTDVNFGVPWQPWVPYFVVPNSVGSSGVTTFCAASDAGYVRGALFGSQ